MEFHIMAIKKSSGSGIPFGNDAGRPANPGIGQLYSNGEAQRLELYTTTGWNNIVQAIPGVSSISGNYSEATSSGTITIAGTNFTNGAVAYAVGQNGLDVVASSTVYNSIIQLTATFNNLSNAQEPYSIRVTNPSGLFGILPNALYVNASPVWQTASGSLGTFIEQVSITLSALSSTDSDSQTITYSLASGSTLPSGVTLNSSTGVISGTLPNITTDTTYSFTVNATDGLNIIPRTFSITSVALIDIEYLIVAGGGAGSNQIAGGGGAGGMRTGTYAYAKTTPISVSVGQGGAAFSTTSSGGRGSNGQNSSAFGLVSTGGGSSGHYSASLDGAAGGSGGGGGGNTAPNGTFSQAATSGGAGESGQGNNGGQGAEYGGGGGGGAGGVGQQGNKGGTRYDSGGNGGPGLTSSITGTSTHYAGGGGGAQRDLSTPARANVWQIRGDGGIGGGGHGSGYTGDNMTGGAYATPGTANTGGGGGGGAHSGTGAGFVGDFRGASGGSGVVVIAYPNTIPAPTTISGGLTYDQPTRAGYRVYRFTAGSGTITF
jgi:hypothetical protein